METKKKEKGQSDLFDHRHVPRFIGSMVFDNSGCNPFSTFVNTQQNLNILLYKFINFNYWYNQGMYI